MNVRPRLNQGRIKSRRGFGAFAKIAKTSALCTEGKMTDDLVWVWSISGRLPNFGLKSDFFIEFLFFLFKESGSLARSTIPENFLKTQASNLNSQNLSPPFDPIKSSFWEFLATGRLVNFNWLVFTIYVFNRDVRGTSWPSAFVIAVIASVASVTSVKTWFLTAHVLTTMWTMWSGWSKWCVMLMYVMCRMYFVRNIRGVRTCVHIMWIHAKFNCAVVHTYMMTVSNPNKVHVYCVLCTYQRFPVLSSRNRKLRGSLFKSRDGLGLDAWEELESVSEPKLRYSQSRNWNRNRTYALMCRSS